MKLLAIPSVTTKEEARELAKNWQIYAGEASLSYGELSEYQGYFDTLGKKFGLTREFKENGVI
jgi:hypothetical protein